MTKGLKGKSKVPLFLPAHPTPKRETGKRISRLTLTVLACPRFCQQETPVTPAANGKGSSSWKTTVDSYQKRRFEWHFKLWIHSKMFLALLQLSTVVLELRDLIQGQRSQRAQLLLSLPPTPHHFYCYQRLTKKHLLRVPYVLSIIS